MPQKTLPICFTAIQILADMDTRVYNNAMKQMFCYTISRLLRRHPFNSLFQT